MKLRLARSLSLHLKVSGAKCFDGQRRCIGIGVKDKLWKIKKNSECKSVV